MSEPTTESFRQLITGWIFAPTHTIYGKRHASFADMLATLRCDSLQKTRETIFSAAGLPPGVEKLIKSLEVLLTLAA